MRYTHGDIVVIGAQKNNHIFNVGDEVEVIGIDHDMDEYLVEADDFNSDWITEEHIDHEATERLKSK